MKLIRYDLTVLQQRLDAALARFGGKHHTPEMDAELQGEVERVSREAQVDGFMPAPGEFMRGVTALGSKARN